MFYSSTSSFLLWAQQSASKYAGELTKNTCQYLQHRRLCFCTNHSQKSKFQFLRCVTPVVCRINQTIRRMRISHKEIRSNADNGQYFHFSACVEILQKRQWTMDNGPRCPQCITENYILPRSLLDLVHSIPYTTTFTIETYCYVSWQLSNLTHKFFSMYLFIYSSLHGLLINRPSLPE